MESPAPQVSVIVPLYNKRGTVGRTIRSVLGQTVKHFEVIVVDDGSTDGSIGEVSAFSDARLRLIAQQNAGPGAARNTGARAARGAVYAFLDADDEWDATFLLHGLSALRAHPKCAAYACGYDSGAWSHVAPGRLERIIGSAKSHGPPSNDAAGELLFDLLNALHSSAVLVRGDVFHQLGGFYEDGCRWGEDSYLWSQVLFSEPIYWDPTPRIKYHVEDSALGFGARKAKGRPISYRGFEMAQRIAPEYRDAFLKLAKSVAARDAADLMMNGHVREALRIRRHNRIPQSAGLVGDARRLAGNVKRRIAVLFRRPAPAA